MTDVTASGQDLAQDLASDTAASADEAVQANINRYWTERADSYDAHHVRQISNDAVKAGWRAVWERVLPVAPARVLDVGTGTGHVALMLAELGYDVTGIDLADGMLAKARQKAASLPNPPALQIGDAVAPDLPANSYDVVTSRYVLWTLRTPLTALRNWRMLLWPGGLLAAVDSTWFPTGVHPAGSGDTDSPLSREAGFRELYSRRVLSRLPLAEATTIDQTAQLMRAAGFTDVTVAPLPEILDLDRRYGVAEGHDVQLQFIITARAGGDESAPLRSP